MATVSRTTDYPVRSVARPDAKAYPAANLRFDWLMAVLSLTTLMGIFLDGWAHNSFSADIETFLTPWHAVLYGGVLACGIALGAYYLWNMNKGYAWNRALPKGYILSLIGFMIFGMSGGMDFAWHEIFGFEADTEALLSPAHLSLATGALLMMTGPLRAAWLTPRSEDRQGWLRLGPAIVSLLTVLSLYTFFAQFANLITHAVNLIGDHPYAPNDWVRFTWQSATVSYVLIPAAITTALILFAIRRWTLPVGALAFILSGNAALMFWLSESYSGIWPALIGAVVGAVLTDVLYAVLRPSMERVRELRLFAFFAPFLMNLAIFVALMVSYPLWWRVHMWLGAPVITGIIGLGLSLLMAPPVIPGETEAA